MRFDPRALAALILVGCLLIVLPLAAAQQVADPAAASTVPLDAELPVDPGIRTGTLDNGLTYYVRANHRPENRAELRLVVNAGSVLEDDDQRGMAHLLEHMAFNGTEHFEKHELIEFMESIGMRLGPDVNAYTSFDETVYMLQVPTDDPEYLSTAFQIMEDWTHAITLDPAWSSSGSGNRRPTRLPTVRRGCGPDCTVTWSIVSGDCSRRPRLRPRPPEPRCRPS